MRSVCCSSCPALPADNPGSAVGMYSKVPSSSGGMNSLPSLESRSEEHTSELQSLMRISYAVFCLKKKKISYSNDRDDNHTTKKPARLKHLHLLHSNIDRNNTSNTT